MVEVPCKFGAVFLQRNRNIGVYNAQKHMEILHAKLSVGILNGHKCILQQNNDDEQNNLKEQEILEVMIWPVQSPDPTITEFIWDNMRKGKDLSLQWLVLQDV